MNLKSNKGASLADVIIAVFVLVIFSTLVISISYNIYINSNFVKRNGQATSYIVDVFEYAKTLNFDTFTENDLVTHINAKGEDITAKAEKYSETSIKSNSPYTMFIWIDEEALEGKEEFIKKIDITVMYKLGTKTKTVSMSTLINK